MQSITLDVIVRVVFGVDGSVRGDELRVRIRTLTAIGRNPFLLFATRDRRLGPLVEELDSGASEYLDATITETLRVRPVIAVVDRHVRQAVRIGGHVIPAGVIACPNIYLAQRRADLYRDPAAFRPDRFVGQ